MANHNRLGAQRRKRGAFVAKLSPEDKACRFRCLQAFKSPPSGYTPKWTDKSGGLHDATSRDWKAVRIQKARQGNAAAKKVVKKPSKQKRRQG